MEIPFPVEFVVQGTPVSAQAKEPSSKTEWKGIVKAASLAALPSPHFASDERIALTLYYFPPERMTGDIDNIVKLVADALCAHIYIDDDQIDRVVVQRFEPGSVFDFSNPSPALFDAVTGPKPVLYVRVSTNPFEDLR